MTLLLCLAVGATAQTRRIAHRSHSGTKHERYDKGDGSYGGPYIPMKKVTKVDTIRETQGKDTVMRLVDSSYYELDTTLLHQRRTFNDMNDVRDLGKVCSRYTGQ